MKTVTNAMDYEKTRFVKPKQVSKRYTDRKTLENMSSTSLILQPLRVLYARHSTGFVYTLLGVTLAVILLNKRG